MNDDEKSKGVLTFFVEERVQVSQSAVLLPCLRVLIMMMMNYDYQDGDYDNYDHGDDGNGESASLPPENPFKTHCKKGSESWYKLIFFVGMTICRAYDSICCIVSLSVFFCIEWFQTMVS